MRWGGSFLTVLHLNRLDKVYLSAMGRESVQLLTAVNGGTDKERRNDILFHPADPARAKLDGAVVYFGGDVQDLEAEQRLHRDNSRYIEWNLEATTSLLASAFQNRHIFTIRPSRMVLKTFSCFDNFVSSDGCGSPSHSADHGAVNHLQAILKNATSQLNLSPDCLQDIVLVGFSKGVVVLNQILHELKTSSEDAARLDRFANITLMLWMDGGHNGGKETWITDKSILASLAGSPIKVRVRLTPYQIGDNRRPWIKKEEKMFTRILKDLGANLERTLYFEEEDPSLANHFRLLSTLVSHPVQF